LEKRGLSYKILKNEDTLEGCTILLLCGGADIGKKPERDDREFRWFQEAYGKMSILGICRGLQLANVALGGTLHEDLSEEKVKHTVNKVDIGGDRPLSESTFHEVRMTISEEFSFSVNSRHHQGVENLAEELSPIVVSREDGLVEAASGQKSLFVQWHPEREEVYGTTAEVICSEWLQKHLQ
jgi:gamma-glutamyl-gamma-aminobutyrate hydrolase PuuD